MQKVMSEITRNVYLEAMKSRKIDFAYPHTKVVFDDNSPKSSA